MNRLLLASALLLAFAAAHGCVGTPGRAIVGALELGLRDLDDATSTGWTVDVERAALLVSAVRVRDATTPTTMVWLEQLVAPRAFAHGGVGETDATVLASWVGSAVLALDDELPPLVLEGRAGVTDRGALVLGGVIDASDPRAAMLHGLPIYLEGTATRGEDVVRFAGGIELPDSETERLVEGIPMGGEIDDGTTVRVDLDLGAWLDAIHFERLTPGDDGVAPITDGTQAAIALRLGMGDLRSYVATVTAP